MKLRGTNPYVMRTLALLLVGFQVLASSRGLVPSICLTLSARTASADSAPASCHASARHSCCAGGIESERESERPAVPRTGEKPGCAFCYLAKALTESPLAIEHPFWKDVVSAPYDRSSGRLASQHVDGTAQGRAPPTLS